MDIKKLLGETTDYDKKETLEEKKPKSWCKSVSAFANGTGGRLYFGITNDDEVVGLEDAASMAEKISENIKVHLDPIPTVHLAIEEAEGNQIVILEVYSGKYTPYYYSGDGQLIAYVRIGNESVPATTAQLRALVLKGSGETYDSLPSRYNFSYMAFTKLRSVYKQRTGNTFDDSDYASFGIVDAGGTLTNAGALLADESPVRQSRLFCTRWNGLDKASGVMDALDDREYTGGLINLLQDGMDFVLNNSRKAWKKTTTGRIEFPDYPERAVQEGIVNALIHRDYLELGSEVHIDMFDDRLEIYSPGGMVSGTSITEENILQIPSVRRNPVIADIFSRLKYMERRGSGFKKIISDYERQPDFSEKKEPVFNTAYDYFILTLYNMNYGIAQDDLQDVSQENEDNRHVETLEGQNVPQSDLQDDPQSDIESSIRRMITDNPKVTREEMAEKMGVSPKTVARRLEKMTDVRYVGSGYSGHWEITD